MAMHARAAVVLLAVGVFASGARGELDPSAARIAFESDRGGNRDIYVMDADGENVTQLTNHLGDDFEPDWSPDGTKLVFASTRDSQFRGHVQLYVVDVETGGVERITDDMKSDLNPRWSPDGRGIAFMAAWRVGGDPRRELHYLDWTTRARRVLLRDDSLDGDGISWSPDGRTIAFSSWRIRGNQELYLLDVEGGKVQQLTNQRGMDLNPAFSPDGKRLLFVSLRNGGIATVHVSDIEAWAPVALPALGWSPAWSPDGSRFVWQLWDLETISISGLFFESVPDAGPDESARELQ